MVELGDGAELAVYDPKVERTYALLPEFSAASHTRALFDATRTISVASASASATREGMPPGSAEMALSLDGNHDEFMADPENAQHAALDVYRSHEPGAPSMTSRSDGSG